MSAAMVGSGAGVLSPLRPPAPFWFELCTTKKKGGKDDHSVEFSVEFSVSSV
jgi:hypothetical protein